MRTRTRTRVPGLVPALWEDTKSDAAGPLLVPEEQCALELAVTALQKRI